MTIMVNSYMSRRIYTSIKWIPSSQEVLLSFKKFALPAIFTKERHLLASMLLRVLVDFISGSVCCSKLYEFFYCYMNDVFPWNMIYVEQWETSNKKSVSFSR